MRKFIRFISFFSAFLSALTIFRPRSGTLRVLLWIPKSLAEAITPFTSLLGAFGSVGGLVFKDVFAALGGFLGFVVSLRHVVRVTAPHKKFDRVFGEGWEALIPAIPRERMLKARWSPKLPVPPRVPWERDVTIGTNVDCGEPIWADIWKPLEGVAPTGLGVIYLHGSGWHFCDKDLRTRRFFSHLAGQGHVIMDVAYTLAPKTHLRGMVSDVKQAIAWFKAHHDKYGIDPERIVLMGGSAGGHLAMLSAYTPNDPAFQPEDMKVDTSVRAVISFYGPADLIHQHDYLRSSFKKFPDGSTRAGRVLVSVWERWGKRSRFVPSYGGFVEPRNILPNVVGGTPEEKLEEFRLGSPLYHIGKHCPPTLLLQGTHDFAGIYPDACRFHRALQEAGVPAILVEFPNTEHAFDILFPSRSPSTQAAIYDVERFLYLVRQDS
jgi:acetyl esterase/lipase